MTDSSITSESPDIVKAARDEVVIDSRDIHVEYRMNASHSQTLKEHVIARLSGKSQWVKTHALKGVSLVAKRGECVALIGHNGCGKSTFLKVLAGILKPARGHLEVKGRVAPLIELGAGFDPELTGRENVYLSCSLMGLTRLEIDDRIEAIHEFSELNDFFDAPIKTYSSGMYMRLGFSCSTAIDADLLLIDEILAVGDENFQKKCVQKMHATRNSGVTSVLVSHDLGVVQSMADRVLVIDHGTLVFEGKPREAVAYYRELMENERLARLSEAERKEELRRKRLLENDVDRRNPSLGEARILTTRIKADQNADALKPGSPWSLITEIEITHPFPQAPVIGYSVLSRENLRLFGGNTQMAGVAFDFAHTGRFALHFDFRTMPLASGEYHVLIAIHDHKLETTIDLHADAVKFRVCDEDDRYNFDRDLIGPTSRQVAISCAASS